MNKQTLVFFNLLRKNTNRRRQQNLARLKKATKQQHYSKTKFSNKKPNIELNLTRNRFLMVKGETSEIAQVSFRSAYLIGRHQGASEHLRTCNYDVTMQLRAALCSARKVAHGIKKEFFQGFQRNGANGNRIFVITRFPPYYVTVVGSSIFLLLLIFSCVLMHADVGMVS